MPDIRLGLYALLLATSILGLPAHAQRIQIVTEELAPYNMTVGGKLTGMSTEVVQALIGEVGVEASFQSMPWARAYDMALHMDNVMIYSISRTPEREGLFQWVGMVAPTRWYLYSAASRPITLESLEQARPYQIATVKQDVGEQYLTEHGFHVNSGLQSSIRHELNYEKLQQGRVDLWISNELNARHLARAMGDNPDHSLREVLDLPDLGNGSGLSIAFSKGTPEETVERFRIALRQMHESGRFEAIVRKWL